MPKNKVLDYIKENLKNSNISDLENQSKIITISREYGCPALTIASDIVAELSKRGTTWNVIDKEVVNQAAKEFDISAELLDKLYKNKPKNNIFGELFSSFIDMNLPDEVKIKKTIAKIIRTIALNGNAVIVGRGGVVVTRDLKFSLHVHLHASKEWRKPRVKNLESLNSDLEALGRIEQVDKDRIYLRNYFAGESTTPNIFDIALNCETLSQSQIVDTILRLAYLKGI